MARGRPELIAIGPDDYHAEHVGRTSEELQFFLTTPFEPVIGGNKGCEYVILFLFDTHGNLVEAQIDSFGPGDSMNKQERRRCYEQRLIELGELSKGRIEIKPFAVERFNTTFGLVPREPEDDDDEWAVELQPGNYMAFFEPWDSGEYDT